MRNTKVVIAEDHEFFRRGIVEAISELNGFEVIGEFGNGSELLEFIPESETDIIITDIKMPIMNGIDATREILKLKPQINVLAISLYGEEEYLEKMIELGVKGFLLKSSDREILEKALNNIANGKQYFSEEFIPYFTKKYISKNNSSLETKLSTRELEILKLISEGHTNNEVAKKLSISTKTAMNHRTRILEKTKSKNTASLLAYAFKNKLLSI